jgi:hypothetical protein
MASVKYTGDPRLRLMRRRFRRRRQRAAGLALAFAMILFLFQWAGYQGKFQPLGEPRPLSEIWWHFPAMAGAFFVLMMAWPWRIDFYDDI